MEAFYGILIPFLGTSLGAACVFFLKKTLRDAVQRALTGFAAGVMVAASVWSLLIPAIAQSAALGRWSFLPAALGFWVGILFLLALDHIIPHLHAKSGQAEGPKSRLQRTTMMVLAVTLHNIPEGMAVGVVYAGYLSGQAQITATGALALSLGIAIQNFPEGAIISLPLRAEGMKKSKAFLDGVLSGAGEWGEVTREQTSAVDMTSTYTDNASRLESARAKKRQLDALYEKAENMEDIITLTDAIFDVQEEIEWLEGQNRRIDNQASMATLYVTINEKSSAVSAKQPFFTRLGRQLADGWENFGEFVSSAVLGLTYALPWVAAAAVVIALARCWIRKKKKQ